MTLKTVAILALLLSSLSSCAHSGEIIKDCALAQLGDLRESIPAIVQVPDYDAMSAALASVAAARGLGLVKCALDRWLHQPPMPRGIMGGAEASYPVTPDQAQRINRWLSEH